MKTKLPYKIISRLRSNAPTRETGGWGRRHEPCSGGESEAVGYKSVCIFVQNGLADHVELFKEIAKGIFKIQQNVGMKYPLLVFGFGNTDHLQHENKYFEFGFVNDSYKYKKVADTIARISGDTPATPAIIPQLFPKTDMRSFYHGKTKIDKDDLLVIIGREDEVFLNESLQGKIRGKLKKQILSVEIGEDEVAFKTKERVFEYKSIIRK